MTCSICRCGNKQRAEERFRHFHFHSFIPTDTREWTQTVTATTTVIISCITSSWPSSLLSLSRLQSRIEIESQVTVILFLVPVDVIVECHMTGDGSTVALVCQLQVFVDRIEEVVCVCGRRKKRLQIWSSFPLSAHSVLWSIKKMWGIEGAQKCVGTKSVEKEILSF